MNVFLVAVEKELINGYELQDYGINFYGLYKKRKRAEAKAKKIMEEKIKKQKLEIIENIEQTKENNPFYMNDCVILHKGNGFSKASIYWIKILKLKIK